MQDATGQVEFVYLLTPANLRDVVEYVSNCPTSKRTVSFRYADNGRISELITRDDSDGSMQTFSNSSKNGYFPENYYEIDGPSPDPDQEHSVELYANFEQHLEWNGVSCSDIYTWHYRARVDKDKALAEQVELNDLGLGHVTLPTSAYYETR